LSEDTEEALLGLQKLIRRANIDAQSWKTKASQSLKNIKKTVVDHKTKQAQV